MWGSHSTLVWWQTTRHFLEKGRFGITCHSPIWSDWTQKLWVVHSFRAEDHWETRTFKSKSISCHDSSTKWLHRYATDYESPNWTEMGIFDINTTCAQWSLLNAFTFQFDQMFVATSRCDIFHCKRMVTCQPWQTHSHEQLHQSS